MAQHAGRCAGLVLQLAWREGRRPSSFRNPSTPRSRSTIARRAVPQAAATLAATGIDPVLARLFAARGIRDAAELNCGLAACTVSSASQHRRRGARLADAIASRERILIVADYDADGATGCAVGVRGLAALGAVVDFPWS